MSQDIFMTTSLPTPLSNLSNLTSSPMPGMPTPALSAALLNGTEPLLDFTVPPELLKSIYILEYRADGAIHHRNFLFSEPSALPGAIERAKLYCNKMRYRFIFCSPFLSDLVRDEKRMEGFG